MSAARSEVAEPTKLMQEALVLKAHRFIFQQSPDSDCSCRSGLLLVTSSWHQKSVLVVSVIVQLKLINGGAGVDTFIPWVALSIPPLCIKASHRFALPAGQN
eukprot:4723510-Amphidinium_carterae.1